MEKGQAMSIGEDHSVLSHTRQLGQLLYQEYVGSPKKNPLSHREMALGAR